MNQFSNTSSITGQMRGVMKVYAANTTTISDRSTVTVNIPEYTPTVAMNDSYAIITLTSNYFANKNFPGTSSTITSNNFITLNIADGTSCPSLVTKGTAFLLLFPSGNVEEGYLIKA